ncbi:connector enhancer of kinase suppressor of ras 1 [Neolamprologus brichardi]|uniref:connector enhancer of kinase suppressor of ras 1 n=1 Tax=Neolamprologus brichardi TaxID=32507 RepID=UPI001643DB76|nr:connector enhancer of kinase suppressor of ras 1 [Neolamprologus brichardi]
MESITSWSEERVSKWLQGLDTPLHQYTVAQWHLSGVDLLQLTSQDLETLGVHKIGHQELILEAVEKLCSLTYGMDGENLRGLIEKHRAVAHSLQMGIQARWRLNSYDGRHTTKLTPAILHLVVELIASAKGLFSLLNRCQYSQLNTYTTTKNIFSYCKELGDIVHKNSTGYEKEKDIISVCRHLVAVCDEILNCCPEALLNHTAQLESVELIPVAPGDQLGIEITSTNSSNHYVTGTAAEVRLLPLFFFPHCPSVLLPQVGWSRVNLVKKLRENPSGVTLVLKKIPGSVRRNNSVPLISTQKEEEDKEVKSEEEEEKDEEESPRHSLLKRVAASVRRAVQGPEVQQQPMGQEESEISSVKELEENLSLTSYQSRQGALLAPAGSESLRGSRLSLNRLRDRSPSPAKTKQDRASISSCPDMVGHTGNKDGKKTSTKGKTTAMSRRRVSCRDLSHPDCDGWLWKKRKESSVFIAQKWQRFWFVLNGPHIYWYKSQQEEKAEGFLNISSYGIESAGEHKRKYVFQMCHPKFQNFIFAADNVNDMSKWINCLITAIQKHKKFNKGPDNEEECYSETESESESSPSTRRKNKKVQSSTLPLPKGKNRAPLPRPTTEGSKGTEPGQVDEMGMMINNLKEGGVSLIGHEQPFTHDHFRKSFIRRNKNPVINEKALTLRALQSTLKAKEAELQQINKILGDSDLTPSKYRQWKKNNEELFKEIEKLVSLKASKAGDRAPEQVTPTEEVALETVAKETAAAEAEGAYRLSLSDGEQLVDAEPSDVLLEMSQASPSTDSSPVLELSLGSLQDSINKQLSEMAQSGDTSESYFFI